jgi:SusD family.
MQRHWYVKIILSAKPL